MADIRRAVGLDPSFFSKVLAGKRNPPAEEEVLRRVADRLELDAPRLIVAAGRIPREWRRLWSDEDLFSSVHGLASETGAVRRPAVRAPAERPPSRGWRRAEERSPSPRKDFGEELL